MMKLKSLDTHFQCSLEADNTLIVDTSKKNGGTGLCLQPFELMEAAVAACMNITVRARTERAGVKVNNVQTTVQMNWSEEGKLIFEYDYSVPGEFDSEAQNLITDSINGCMMRQLLTHRKIEFKKVKTKEE